MECGPHCVQARAQRLLTENMQTKLNGLDGLFCMHSSGRGHDDGLQLAFLSKHLIVGEIGPDAVEVLGGPGQLGWVWRGDSHQFGTGSQVMEVEGMA